MAVAVTVVVLGATPLLAEALRAVLDAGPREITCSLQFVEELPRRSVPSDAGVVVAAPRRWKEMQSRAQALAEWAPALPVAVLADVRLPGMFALALPETCALLAAHAPPSEIRSTLRALLDGRVLRPIEAVRTHFNRGMQLRAEGPRAPRLTDMQLQVACAVSMGLTNRAMADLYTIDYGTIKNHVHDTLAETHLKRRDELADFVEEVLVATPLSER